MKTILLSLFFVLSLNPILYSSTREELGKRSITTNALASNEIAEASSFSISFSVSKKFPKGNIFSAQISDVYGSFSNATVIGTITGTSSGSITATLPTSILAGYGYRVRVISTKPVIIGSDNGQDINISAPSILPSRIPNGYVCAGSSTRLGLQSSGFKADNIFYAEMSDISGSYANAIVIGTLAANSDQSVITIPAGTETGVYKIRIRSTNPANIYENFGLSIAVRNCDQLLTISQETTSEKVAKNTITTTAVASHEICEGTSFPVSFSVSKKFPKGNIFKVEISNVYGSFSNPTVIGTQPATSSGTITATLPTSISAGYGYRVRVVSTNPSIIGTDNGQDINIGSPSILPSRIPNGYVCAGSQFYFGVQSSCFKADNVFYAEISDASGSYADAKVIGTVAENPEQSNIIIPAGTASGTYKIRVRSTNPAIIFENYGVSIAVQNCGQLRTTNEAITSTVLNSVITTNALTSNNICEGSSFPVSFSVSKRLMKDNVFKVQISDAYGSFNNPTVIGTKIGTTSGTITATLPASILEGYGYRARVVSTKPAIIGSDNGQDITVSGPSVLPSRIPNGYVCAGSALYLGVQSSCFKAGNIFYAEMSDTSGSYANAQVIGTIAENPEQSNIIIPQNTASGIYKIRIRSTNPAIIYENYGISIAVQNCGLLRTTDETTSEVVIYPNPCKSSFKIQNGKNYGEIAEVRIFDAIGLIKKNINFSNNSEVSLDALPNGTYYVNIIFKNKKSTTKGIQVIH